jgi:hypothetical protein
MRWAIFVCGLVVGVLVGAGGVVYWQKDRAVEPHPIMFGQKVFSDSEATIGIGIVYIVGTITGEGQAYPNNTYAVTCYEDRRECLVSSAHDIGMNMIGRLDMPQIIPIIRWNKSEIVAQEDVTELQCVRTTLTIERKTESALWVDEPVNQTRPSCKYADGRTHKYTIEDSPNWKKVFDKK